MVMTTKGRKMWSKHFRTTSANKISGISPHSKIMLINRIRSSSISLPAKMVFSIVIPWKSADFPLFMIEV
jgi:hypothetical protein